MKSKRNLMTVLVGLAMLATPITAAAKDRYAHNYSHAARVSRSFNAPARSYAPARNFAPAAVARRGFRNNAVAARGGWRGGHNGWNRGEGDADDYQNYGNPGYYPAPAYIAPGYGAGYGAGYGGGQNCAGAQRITNTYNRDRNTGHSAAAYDLLRQNQWAFRSGCAGGSPYAGGLLGGLGGYGGVPAYNNYGGYNGGYGQPYGSGSMLAPLLQQFVR